MSRDPILDTPRKTTEEMVLEMEQMELNRRARLVALDEEYGAYMRQCYGQPFYQDGQTPLDVVKGDFILVEKSRHDSSYYVTVHDTPQGAAEYHDGQEYPEDWNIEFLENVETGEILEPQTSFTTTWTPKQEDS